MELINEEVPAHQYDNYKKADPIFAQICSVKDADSLPDQIISYSLSGQQMGDETDQPKLQQRSNPWFFSKNFSGVFDVLEEAKTNRSINQAFSPAIKLSGDD